MLKRTSLTGVLLSVALLTLACAQGASTPSLEGQGDSAPSLEGAWRIVQRSDTANADLDGTGSLSLFILTKEHYAVMSVQSNQPRPVVEVATPGEPTDAEKLALFERMNLFVGNAGTYEFDGTTLVRHQTVTTGVLAGATPITTEIEFDGNNAMWQITKLEPSGERRTKYERVE